MNAPAAGIGSLREELRGFVLRRVDHAEDAEDIVQDVFVRALRHRDDLRDPARLRAWLFQITRNAIVDHYRARRPTEPLPADLEDDGSGQEDAAAKELSQCLVSMTASLPERYREAVEMADLEGRTQAEVAESAGISLSGAKSRVQRGRRMLADRLIECCRVELDAAGRVADYDMSGGCNRCD